MKVRPCNTLSREYLILLKFSYKIFADIAENNYWGKQLILLLKIKKIVSTDLIFDLTLARIIFVELTFVKSVFVSLRFALVVGKYVFLKTSEQLMKITGVDQGNLKLIMLSLKCKPIFFLTVTFSGLNSVPFKNK